MPEARIPLDHWRVLQAVVDHGTVEAAAEHLHRSQWSVSYTVGRLQQRLPVAVLAQQGRRAVLSRRVALAIGARVPPGFLAEPLVEVEFVAVAHPAHPLHHLERAVSAADLRTHRQIVVRDTGPQGLDAGWLGAEQRCTVSHMRTSLDALARGLGFAWVPRDLIGEHLAAGRLRPLPLASGATREATLHLIFAAGESAGPGAQELARLLRVQAGRYTAARRGA
jgi:DNA-binding transcriptional LysR family regulator